MLAHPEHWRGYYHGSDEELRLARRYSLSDRSRYYWAAPRLQAAVQRLLENLAANPVPLTLVSQFLPHLVPEVREGIIAPVLPDRDVLPLDLRLPFLDFDLSGGGMRSFLSNLSKS